MQETGNNIKDKKELSIRFSVGGFSLFTGEEEKRIDFSLPDTSFLRCCAICLCEEAIWKDYSNINIQIDDEPATLVPSSVFSQTDCLSLMRFNYPSIDFSKYTIETQSIDGFDITNTIAVNCHLSSFIKEYLPHATITHISSKLVSKALRGAKTNERCEVWAYQSFGSLFVAVAENGNLILSNRYNITSDTDILYWIGAIFNQFKLSQQHTPLYFSGEKNNFETLKEHIANCSSISL